MPFSFCSALFIDYVYSFSPVFFTIALVELDSTVIDEFNVELEFAWCSLVLLFKVSFNFIDEFYFSLRVLLLVMLTFAIVFCLF